MKKTTYTCHVYKKYSDTIAHNAGRIHVYQATFNIVSLKINNIIINSVCRSEKSNLSSV